MRLGSSMRAAVNRKMRECGWGGIMDAAKHVDGCWQPIETAPTDEDHEILVWGPHGYDVASVWWWDDEKPVWFNGDVSVQPTHWMPLPSAPSTIDRRLE